MIDFIILLVIGLNIGIGYKKGLVKTIYELGTSLAALAIAFFIYPITRGILKMTPIYTGIIEWNRNKIVSLEVVSGLQSQAEVIRQTTMNLPEFIREALVRNNNPEVYTLLGVKELVDYVSTYVANICITALAVVITFVIVKIILMAIGGILDFVTKLPLIHTANQLGGVIAGGVKGLLFIYLALLVLPFFERTKVFSSIFIQVQESLLGNYLYQHNILLRVIENLMF
jgi:uncharacterized membrane protein required for colicin V production